ncbi:Hypothetical protein A7982_06227 [Minicystis rosea]|nr:Hypothetical protein A7982_06227 [Minicystis rosea]
MPDDAPRRSAKTLPARIQARLAGYYGIEDAPAVDDFVEPADGDRESLLVREQDGALELSLRLPRAAIEGARAPSFDEVCQVVEGVSHFLYLAERARRELPATHLELELQAEVDKYVLFAHGANAPRPFHPARAARMRARLFERVAYLHPPHTETGARYRMANDLAARFAGRLELRFARHGHFGEMRAWLRRFYGAGQAEKIGLAQAA